MTGPPGPGLQRVIYDAVYTFDPPVDAMALQLRLRPLPRPGQSARGIRLATVPECEARRMDTDAWGVIVETASFPQPLRRLRVNADWTVDPRADAPLPCIAPGHDDLVDDAGRMSPRRDLATAEADAMARAVAAGWTYDLRPPPAVRSLATLVEERRGGCEDLARLCADVLRREGVPVRFVVGYLGARLTPVARRHRRHAWLAIWTSDRGWCEIDPLHDDMDVPLLATAWGPVLPALQPVSGRFATGRVTGLSVEVQVLPSHI
ncbi:MAG: hypothetical protein B7Z14_02985 [Bosea sp. 32-68-6]|nr:MAG: hypothetical protein B7Z14_02985 [Bosea sp. 32-68-6]